MGVLQRHPAAVGPPDMADHDPALQGIVAQEPRDLRFRAWARVVEAAAPLAFVERDAPAVAMRTGLVAPAHQPGEAEADVGRDVGAHAQKLAHAGRSQPWLRKACSYPWHTVPCDVVERLEF